MTEEKTTEAPKTKEVEIVITTKCPEGPAEEHQWTPHEIIGQVYCEHCGIMAPAVKVVLLYQTQTIILNQSADTLVKRLERESGHKVITTNARENCTTDREKELYDEREYFKQRLDEEIKALAKTKKDMASTSRKMDEVLTEGKKKDVAIEDLRKDRNAWKSKCIDLHGDVHKGIKYLQDINQKNQ